LCWLILHSQRSPENHLIVHTIQQEIPHRHIKKQPLKLYIQSYSDGYGSFRPLDRAHLQLKMATTGTKSALDLVNELILELELAVNAAPAAVKKDSAAEKGDNGKSEGSKKAKPVKTNSAAAAPASAAAADENAPLNVNALDLRVGVITKVWRHETAEKLYCEEIDVGEAEPRQIASGLVPHYSLEEMQGRRLIVVCNLAPRKLVGFKSSGMVLCAAKHIEPSAKEKVEFVDPPVGAAVGERVVGRGLIEEPLSQKQCDKRKAFETIAPALRVNAAGVAVWGDVDLVAKQCGEVCVAPTLRDAQVR
jgi:aminoacyl tRNA synthase complex-interacting multifunctional protein 1